MKYSSRFFLYAPLSVFGIFLIAVGVHWWLAASHLSSRLDAVNGREIMPGVTLSFAAHRTTGFPFSLDTEFKDVTLTLAGPRGKTTWRTAEFAMHALTYGRDETIFEAAGPQKLSFTREGKERALPFAVGALRASANLKKDALARFDLDLVGFGSKAFTAQRLQFHLRRNGGDKLEVFAAADDVRTPTGSCPRLGDGMTKLRFTGAFTQAGEFSSLLAGDQNLAATMTGWRAAGGFFKSSDLKITKAAGLQTALREIPAEDFTSVEGVNQAFCGEAH